MEVIYLLLMKLHNGEDANFDSGTVEINIPVSFSTFDSPNTTSSDLYKHLIGQVLN